jgi:predicted nucleotidyltransferase/HEPN domain-containing protein
MKLPGCASPIVSAPEIRLRVDAVVPRLFAALRCDRVTPDAMKHSLEHLPARKQRQLDTIVKTIRAAVEVEMIILYGSHARGDWVEDTRGHKFSDYDVLVIVDTRARAEDIDLWSNIRDRCELLVRRNHVQIIVHDIDDVNHQLEDGWYFFVDVEREGVMLHDSGRHTLARPRPKSRAERRAFAQECFREYMETADRFYALGIISMEKDWNKTAAFQFHQATENYYKCAILVLTAYWPREHNIKYLGKVCANLDPAFRDIFPRRPPAEKRRLELLKEAYVKARYSLKWRISREDLEVLAQRIAVLRERTQAVCQAFIDSLDEQPAPA